MADLAECKPLSAKHKEQDGRDYEQRAGRHERHRSLPRSRNQDDGERVIFAIEDVGIGEGRYRPRVVAEFGKAPPAADVSGPSIKPLVVPGAMEMPLSTRTMTNSPRWPL